MAAAFRDTVTNRKVLTGTLTWLRRALCCLQTVLEQDLLLPACIRWQRVSHKASAKPGLQQFRQCTSEMSFLSTLNMEEQEVSAAVLRGKIPLSLQGCHHKYKSIEMHHAKLSFKTNKQKKPCKGRNILNSQCFQN